MTQKARARATMALADFSPWSAVTDHGKTSVQSIDVRQREEERVQTPKQPMARVL
jgi:hypothetical protein